MWKKSQSIIRFPSLKFARVLWIEMNLFEALYTLQSLGLLHNNLIETVNNDKNKSYVYYRLQ